LLAVLSVRAKACVGRAGPVRRRGAWCRGRARTAVQLDEVSAHWSFRLLHRGLRCVTGARACAQFGGVDIMVANAGIVKGAEFLDMREEDFGAVIGVNLKGVFLVRLRGRAGRAASRPPPFFSGGLPAQEQRGAVPGWFCQAVTAASVRHARPALRSPGTTRAPGVGPAGPLHRRPRHMSARPRDARPAERMCGGRAQCGQAAARQMVEQNRAAPGRGGAIINMSSVNAVMAIPSIAGYNASKGGVNNLTRCGPCPLRPPRPALSRALVAAPRRGCGRAPLPPPARQEHGAVAGAAQHPRQRHRAGLHHDARPGRRRQRPRRHEQARPPARQGIAALPCGTPQRREAGPAHTVSTLTGTMVR